MSPAAPSPSLLKHLVNTKGRGGGRGRVRVLSPAAQMAQAQATGQALKADGLRFDLCYR